MANRIIGGVSGTVFEVGLGNQYLIQSNLRTNKLQSGTQEMLLENLSNGQNLIIAKGDIGTLKQELITVSACLYLSPAIYRWSQKVEYFDNQPPDYLSFSRDIPVLFQNFGIGGPQPLEITNIGTNNVYSLISSPTGRTAFARGKITYDLAVGEKINAEIEITNTVTGQKINSGIVTVTGPRIGTLETGIIPFVLQANQISSVILKIQNLGLKPVKGVLIQNG
jgi:hypothetical protein